MKYEIRTGRDANGDEIINILANDENDNSFVIPTDPANSDYQRYLRWLEDPEADESGTL